VGISSVACFLTHGVDQGRFGFVLREFSGQAGLHSVGAL